MTNFIEFVKIVFLFFVISLAVWRVSSLVAREHGPFDVFLRFRAFVGVEFDKEGETFGTNEFAKGIICVWCNSIWFSAIGAIFVSQNVFEWVMYMLAMSAVTILVDSKVVG